MKQINNNITEKLVSFEVAKLAYEKGFNNPNKGYYVPMYNIDGELFNEKLGYNKELPEPFEFGFIIAPTQNLLIDWIRINFSVHIECIMDIPQEGPHDGCYTYVAVMKTDEAYKIKYFPMLERQPTPEKAKEIALKHFLTNLI